MGLIRRFFAELKMVWLYLPAVLSLMVVGTLCLRIVEGRDLMLYTAESGSKLSLTLFSIMSWALMLWYSSRIVARAVHKEQLNRMVNQMSLGYTGILIFQLAVYNVVLAREGWSVWILTGLPLGWYLYACIPLLWEALMSWRQPPWWVWGAVPLAIASTVLPYTLFAQETAMLQSSPYLAHFSVALFWLGVLYTLYTRELFLKKFLTETVEDAIDNVAGKAWTKTLDTAYKGFRKVYEVLEKTRENWGHFVAFNLYSAQVLFVLIWAGNDYEFASFIGPVSALLLGLTVCLGALNLITFISVKFAGINLHVLLIVWMLIMGLLHDPYQARTLDALPESFSQRPQLEEALVNHFYDSRGKPLRQLNATELPLYFVLSDGGAFRSAYWVAQLLDTLDRHSEGRFFKELFCLSGSSGGSVGNTLFYNGKLRNSHNAEKVSRGVDAFFSRDLLSFSFVHMFSTDVLTHLIPVDWLRGDRRKKSTDRAVALEIGMERSGNGWISGESLEQPLLATLNNYMHMPLLVYNATELQRGRPVILTNLRTESLSERQNLADLLAEHQKGSEIRFSTAAVLGARFPYLNPAGGIGNHYFVDGGYIENSGAGIVHELIMGCKALLDSTHNPKLLRIRDKISYRVIHISNSTPKASENQRIHPLVNDLGAPILTLVASRGQQTSINNDRLKRYLQSIQPSDLLAYTQLSLYQADEPDAEPYPMNWVISAYNRHRMQIRKQQISNLQPLLQQFSNQAKPPAAGQ
ncbi:MAG: hypothetical protein ACK417_10370 [Bacteroidia bacterium]